MTRSQPLGRTLNVVPAAAGTPVTLGAGGTTFICHGAATFTLRGHTAQGVATPLPVIRTYHTNGSDSGEYPWRKATCDEPKASITLTSGVAVFHVTVRDALRYGYVEVIAGGSGRVTAILFDGPTEARSQPYPTRRQVPAPSYEPAPIGLEGRIANLERQLRAIREAITP